MLWVLKLTSYLLKRRNDVTKRWQQVQQSTLHKLIVNKVNLLVSLLPAALATIILMNFLAAKLDVLNLFDILPEKLQLVFLMPIVLIMAFGPVGLLLVPIGYYWTYKILFFKGKRTNAASN